MKKRFLAIYLAIFLFLLSSCGGNQKATVIGMKSIKGSSAFLECVNSISLRPLETDDVHLMGSNLNLIVTDDSYILIDKLNGSIFRYSFSGQFLNEIGHKGRGPLEYTNIESVQWVEDRLVVFSIDDKMLTYTKDGHCECVETIRGKGSQSYLMKDGVLTYYSYLPAQDYRMAILNGDDLTTFLPSNPVVMTYLSDAPVFSSYDEDVFVIDSYSSVLYKYHDKRLEEYLSFDFGRFAIKDEFYHFEDPYESAYYLTGTEFALINRYLESDRYKIVEILVQTEKGTHFNYGMFHEDRWFWFSEPESSQFFSNTIRSFRGDRLYCLTAPETLLRMPDYIADYISNPEVISTLKEDSNYVVIEVELK